MHTYTNQEERNFMSTFKAEQTSKMQGRIDKLLSSSPPYLKGYSEYCLATKSLKPGTVYYALIDIHSFLQYIRTAYEISTDDITIQTLGNMDQSGIENYLIFLKERSVQNNKKVTNRTSSIVKKLSSLRSFYKYLVYAGLLERDPTALVRIRNEREKELDYLSRSDSSELLNSASSGNGLSSLSFERTSELRLRDYAIILLLLSTGIKTSECAGIDCDDVLYDSNEIIMDKGRDEPVYLQVNSDVLSAISEYITFERRESLLDPGALFISKKGQRMSVSAIERMVKKYAKAALGVENITPSSLRSTFAVHLFRQTEDPYLVGSALFVSKNNMVNTIRRYDSEKERRRMAAELIKGIYDEGQKEEK